MLATDMSALSIVVLTFVSVTMMALSVLKGVARRDRVRSRFGTASNVSLMDLGPPEKRVPWFGIDPARFGVSLASQRHIRGELVRAGIFSPHGVPAFLFWRYGSLVGLPLLAYLVVRSSRWSHETITQVLVVALVAGIAHLLPSAYLSWRSRHLQDRYRVTFPDFVDMLVVCINAGLSLDAALDRVARELRGTDAELRANLDLMAGEMRAGVSTVEALRSCAERLGLPEARSFAALLQQTIELGTDLAAALAVFSDEMRDKRMARAEEKAASLPPKLTLPLGLFIFPVVLIVVLAPAVLKVVKAAGP